MGRRARSVTTKEPQRRRLALDERERPGSVIKGPLITVECECGERHGLFYGERWKCSCGRAYDSNQIPREEYEAVRRTQRRYRVLPVLFGLAIALLALLFTLTGNTFSVFLLLPMGIILWFLFLRPVHRQRYRAAIQHLPRWTLRAE